MNTHTARRGLAALSLAVALPLSATTLVACADHPRAEPPAPVARDLGPGEPVPSPLTDIPIPAPAPPDHADGGLADADPCAGIDDPGRLADCLVDQLGVGADEGGGDGTAGDEPEVPDLGPDHTPGYWDDVCAGGAVCNPGSGGLPDFTPGGGLSFTNP